MAGGIVAAMLLLAQAAPSEVEALLGRAVLAEREGRLEEAAEAYRGVKALLPRAAAIPFNLALVLQKRGKLTEALSEIEGAIALDPRDSSFHHLHGRILRALDNPERAIEAFERALALDPDSRDLCFEIAELHQSRREFEPAALWLRRYLERHPEDLEARYFLGTVLSYGSATEEARRVLGEVVAADPKHARAWFRLAHIEAQTPSTMVAAAESYRRSLELAGEEAYVWYEYGTLLDKLGRSSEAVPAFERALALDPELSFAVYALGNALSREGRTDEARAYLERFKEKRDDEERRDAEAKRALSAFARGREHLEQNRLDEAIAAFLEMTERNPKAHQGYAFLAKAHFSRKETAIAIAYVRRAIELSPGTAEYPFLLSLFLKDRGDLEGAKSALATALALDPENATLHNAHGVLLEDAGDPVGAVSALERAAALDPSNPVYSLNLALAYQKLGLAEKAQASLSRYRDQLGIR
jgi:tetratricopeptide (TPR) repeat protein